MALLPVVFYFLLASVSAVKTPPGEDFYRAAVVEYHPDIGADGSQTLQLNVKRFVSLIQQAALYADIVVFPEAALIHSDFSIFFKVPFGKNATPPADDVNIHPALRQLSASARNTNIYVAVNLHEEETVGNVSYRYNTNVVFDRNGSVVARYRKYNLFSEVRALNITDTPEHSYFDSDFGVRFGTFTCFDILFKDPTLALQKLNVTDYIFPTWWFSELPFLTAIQEQAAWAYTTDSNLLAAGGNNVNIGSSGSGIYNGKKGPVIYIQSTWNETLLLVAKVFKKNANGTSTGEIINSAGVESKERGRLEMKTDRLEVYNTFPLTPKLSVDKLSNISNVTTNRVFKGEICQGTFCCSYYINASYTFTRKSLVNLTEIMAKDDGFQHHEYRVGVFNGVRSFDGFATGGVQVCGVVGCLNGSAESCGRPTMGAPLTESDDLLLTHTRFHTLRLETNSLAVGGLSQPSLLLPGAGPDNFGALPRNYSFHRSGTAAHLNVASDSIATAAIYSRVFSRDGGPTTVYSSASLLKNCNISHLLVAFITFLYHVSFNC